MSNPFPAWAREPFTEFLNHTEELYELLDISKRGISMMEKLAVSDAVELMEAIGLKNEELKQYSLEIAGRKAALAQSEAENDYPLLHAQMAISLWASVESLIRTFLVAWLANKPEAKTCDELKKVKIRIGEYESLTDDDKYFYVLDLLEDSIGTRKNPGIGRFEALFEVFGLSSRIPENIKRDLLELYFVRNVLVHRHGIADRKFIEGCPWLGLLVNQQVIVTSQVYVRYYHAAVEYVVELAQRVSMQFDSGE